MIDTLTKKMNKLGDSVREREAGRVLQFPLWPEKLRGIPNPLVRSALFTARKRVGNEMLRDIEIFCQGGITITHTGPWLTQDHLDVYEGVMHLARQQEQESTVEFTSHGLLKLIGRRTGGTDHRRLRTTLKDLSASVIEIRQDNEVAYWGSLLPDGSFEKETGVFKVTINRRLIAFFNTGFTLVEQEKRKSLARSPLARHLQGFLSSHRKPYPLSVAQIYKLTGSESRELKHFRAQLKKALNRLVEVGVLEAWSLSKNDIISFTMSVDKSLE